MGDTQEETWKQNCSNEENVVNYKFKHDDMESWLILTAIGADRTLIDQMERNPDGSYPVKFEVGGVTLNFFEVAKRIDESIDVMVTEKAKKLLDQKFNGVIGEINEIQERLENQKATLFQYDWEKEE